MKLSIKLSETIIQSRSTQLETGQLYEDFATVFKIEYAREGQGTAK